MFSPAVGLDKTNPYSRGAPRKKRWNSLIPWLSNRVLLITAFGPTALPLFEKAESWVQFC
jgi:hypothetical protein